MALDPQIFARARKVIADHLTGQDPTSLNLTDRFAEDLNADSLDMVELTMAFEEEFAIEIDDDETDGIVTVEDAFTLLNKKLEQ